MLKDWMRPDGTKFGVFIDEQEVGDYDLNESYRTY